MVSPLRVLGATGVISAALSTVGGMADVPVLIGIGAACMLVGNIYAIVRGRQP